MRIFDHDPVFRIDRLAKIGRPRLERGQVLAFHPAFRPLRLIGRQRSPRRSTPLTLMVEQYDEAPIKLFEHFKRLIGQAERSSLLLRHIEEFREGRCRHFPLLHVEDQPARVQKKRQENRWLTRKSPAELKSDGALFSKNGSAWA